MPRILLKPHAHFAYGGLEQNGDQGQASWGKGGECRECVKNNLLLCKLVLYIEIYNATVDVKDTGWVGYFTNVKLTLSVAMWDGRLPLEKKKHPMRGHEWWWDIQSGKTAKRGILQLKRGILRLRYIFSFCVLRPLFSVFQTEVYI